MKRWELGSIVMSIVITSISPSGRACAQPGNMARTDLSVAGPVELEIDPAKITAAVGVPFQVLKTEALGRTTRNKFFWICLEERPTPSKLEELAMMIVSETIAARPATYHSFTLHFFLKNGLRKVVEESTPFARATYLPEGSLIKVGRASIEDYGDYRLTLTWLENR